VSRMSPTVRALACRVVLGLLTAIAPACTCCKPCTLEDALATAPPTAVDCGRLESFDASDPVVDCVANAIDSGQSLRVRVRRQGIDSQVEEAFAGSQDGGYLVFMFDSDVSGSGSSCRAVINVRNC